MPTITTNARINLAQASRLCQYTDTLYLTSKFFLRSSKVIYAPLQWRGVAEGCA